MRDTRYRRKPFAFDAVQVTEADWAEVAHLLRRRGIVAATRLEPVEMVDKAGKHFTRRYVHLFTPHGRLVAGEGDWVSWDESGEIRVWPAEEFEANFEPCGLSVRPPAPTRRS